MKAEQKQITESEKTRDQLLFEYSQIKANPYFQIFRFPAFLILLVVVDMYFSESSDLPVWGVFFVFNIIEIVLWNSRQDKKLNILYELEKCRVEGSKRDV